MNAIDYLTKDTEELKKLIAENPDLPIVILADEDSHGFYSGWTYCTSITFSIAEILCCDFYDYNDGIIDDRDRLEELIGDDIYDKHPDMPEDEYEAAIKKEVVKYEPYWKKVIAIWATN